LTYYRNVDILQVISDQFIAGKGHYENICSHVPFCLGYVKLLFDKLVV